MKVFIVFKNVIKGCLQSTASLIEGLCGIHSVNRFNRSNRGLRLSLTDNRGLGFWRLNPNLGQQSPLTVVGLSLALSMTVRLSLALPVPVGLSLALPVTVGLS